MSHPYENECRFPAYSQRCEVSMYAHIHCADCGCTLMGVGDSDAPGGIGGYDDEHGNSARQCRGCDAVLCKACHAKSLCGSEHGCPPGCTECVGGAA